MVNRLQWAFTRIELMVFGRTGRTMGGHVAAAPTLLLTTTGRRSGVLRTTPLVFVPEGESFLVVAAYGGSPWDPYWVMNLRDNNCATVEVNGTHIDVMTSFVEGDERDALWPQMRERIASLHGAEQRTRRTIPLVRLAPRSTL